MFQGRVCIILKRIGTDWYKILCGKETRTILKQDGRWVEVIDGLDYIGIPVGCSLATIIKNQYKENKEV